ncbi:unnamed protein product [Paramecium pentaurelia]|uniref:Uncharacterized protein n=1 Tax=Paramecium pentaurelia TaxID=43138 RepID=A0A8S1RZ77_9CILI|nr:unnamed protein product [Paramecium pentaurelia]
MFQYSQRILQPTLRVPSQIQQSIIMPLENHPQLQSTRKVQLNFHPTTLNTSPIKIVNNNTPLSPNLIVYSQNHFSLTPLKIPSNTRQNLTPPKNLNANIPQQRNFTPTGILNKKDQTDKNTQNLKNRVQIDFGISPSIQQQTDRKETEFLNDKQQSSYNNLQELLIQSEFKISQLEQKSRQMQDQRKRLHQQFISKSPKLGSLL